MNSSQKRDSFSRPAPKADKSEIIKGAGTTIPPLTDKVIQTKAKPGSVAKGQEVVPRKFGESIDKNAFQVLLRIFGKATKI